MRILSVDPGTTNFAYSVLSVKETSGGVEYKIRKMGMVEKTIREPKERMVEQTQDFYNEFLQMFEKTNVQGFICERFQSRGMKGNTIESVNMMVGIMAHHFSKRKANVRLVTASTWKNRVNKIVDMKELYSLARVPHHITDAVCLGLYHGTFLLKGNAFEGFQDHTFRILAERINNESVPFS